MDRPLPKSIKHDKGHQAGELGGSVLVIDATRDRLFLELLPYPIIYSLSSIPPLEQGHILNNTTPKLREVKFQYLNEVLLASIQDFLIVHGIPWSDIHALAINQGPGAYNGIRISVVVVKTIAFFLNIPIYTFDGFMVMQGWQQSIKYKQFLQTEKGGADTNIPSVHKLSHNSFEVMVLNPSGKIFFLALGVTNYESAEKPLKTKRIGNIIALGKTTALDNQTLKHWFKISHKLELPDSETVKSLPATITAAFKLTASETESINPTTEVSEGEAFTTARWVFFDERSYKNFINFIELNTGENNEISPELNPIIWDKVFQTTEDNSALPYRSYQKVVETAIKSSSGEVMGVTPHYYRNFGE